MPGDRFEMAILGCWSFILVIIIIQYKIRYAVCMIFSQENGVIVIMEC